MTHDTAGLARAALDDGSVNPFVRMSPSDGAAVGTAGTRSNARPDRRRYTVETLRRSLVDPRRFTARRREDRRCAQLDRFDAGLLALAVLLVGLSILDSLFTLMLISRGGTEENPFMDAVLGHGVWAFTAVKMTLTAVPAVLLVATGNLPLFGRSRRGRRGEATTGSPDVAPDAASATRSGGFRVRSVLAALVGGYIGLIVYELALLSLG